MALKKYKNDYKIYTDLQRFANENPVGKVLKPLVKDLYKWAKRYLPYPRDFLLRKIPKGGVFCEVGVYEGVFSERILRIAKPKKLYLVDPWMSEGHTGSRFDDQGEHDKRHAGVLQKFKREIYAGTVTVLRKTSDDAIQDFADVLFDFVYLDGDHSHGQLEKDLENYYRRVRPGGYLCGDDFDYAGVKQAVEEFAKKELLTVEEKDDQFIIQKPTIGTL